MARMMLTVPQAHRHFPILHDFRPIDRAHALPVRLGRLDALLRRLEAPARGDALDRLADDPAIDSLRAALDAYLEEVDGHFVPPRFRAAPSEPPDKASERAGRYRRLLACTCWAPADDDRPERETEERGDGPTNPYESTICATLSRRISRAFGV